MHLDAKKDPPTGGSVGQLAFPGRTAAVTAISQCYDRTCGMAVGGRRELCGFFRYSAQKCCLQCRDRPGVLLAYVSYVHHRNAMQAVARERALRDTFLRKRKFSSFLEEIEILPPRWQDADHGAAFFGAMGGGSEPAGANEKRTELFRATRLESVRR